MCEYCKAGIALLSGEDWIVFIDKNRLVCCIGGETYDFKEINSCPICNEHLVEPIALTLDELRGMDGQPVWVERVGDGKFKLLPKWCISEFYNVVDNNNNFLYECFRLTSGRGARVEDYGKTWLAYSSKLNI